MAQHSVAEAKNHLSDLIERALKGENVVITRHGRPVVELTPVPAQPGPMTQEEIDWVMAHRGRWSEPGQDAAELVSRMRDEDWDE